MFTAFSLLVSNIGLSKIISFSAPVLYFLYQMCIRDRGRPVMEFGSRRAHGADAAIMGARAAYIGGCSGTACAIADRDYGIVALGTMAHSWVQMYPCLLYTSRCV